MQNNNPNDYLQEDEIDLKEIFKLLINSKKLIVVITLFFTTLGAIYSFQKTPIFKSTALIEIGHYVLNSTDRPNRSLTIEPSKTLIKELTIKFNHKQNALDINSDKLVINFLEDRLIQISHTSSSSATSNNLLSLIMEYIENRHSLLLSNLSQKTKNQLTYKIESITDQIEYSNSELLTQYEDKKIRISNLIKSLNSKLSSLDRKIESLNQIIVADENNLLLLQSNPELFIQRAVQSPTLDQVIFTYRSSLIDYETEKNKVITRKDTLENQLKLMESNVVEAEKIFKLLQEKDRLELELEFLMNQNPTSTQLIGEIVTNTIDSKKELIILVSFIFGLFLSIVIVLINNFLKAFKEE
jgi:capsular polysaccharide biosynthesis protein